MDFQAKFSPKAFGVSLFCSNFVASTRVSVLIIEYSFLMPRGSKRYYENHY